MALSEEDKQRIQAEEEERERIRRNIKEKENKKVGKGCGIALLSIFLLAVIITVSIVTCSSGSSGPEELNAAVRFDGAQFHISNNDDYDWVDVKLQVNSDYELRVGRMDAMTEYSVGAMQFTKGDGTRFNPFGQKAKNFFIWAHTEDGHSVSWYGSWE